MRLATATLLMMLAAPALAQDTVPDAPNSVAGRAIWKVIARGLSKPLGLAYAPGDPVKERLFIVEQTGKVRALVNGVVEERPLLDVGDRLSHGTEQGLLGLAFHPKYAENGRLFINYTDKHGDTHIAEFRVRKEAPGRVDPASEKDWLKVDQPYSNHNGGQLVFGPDGKLYIGLGDGGSHDDPHGNGQNRRVPLGKMLRLDVDAPQFSLETHLIGLRNPWRYSFDRATGDLYIADVGQNKYEEIDVLAAADALCQGSATAGGLPSSTYKAWLSVGATDAISRFAGARAWVRPDGMPFADTLAGLASGQIFYPLAIDEQGGQSSRSTWTGTNAQGTASGVNCTDFTVSAATGFTTIGDPRAGGALFSAYFTTNCSLTYALYCLGTTSSAALGYTFAGRRAFVSSGTMIGSAGVATGDALCSSEAGLASLAGTFRAFLDTAALPARSRFDTSLAPWVRADGTLLSVSAATFDPLSVSQLAPLSQHADGNYLTSLDLAWIGGPGQRCADWTSAAGNGLVGPAAELAQISSTDSCSTSHPVFCLQQ